MKLKIVPATHSDNPNEHTIMASRGGTVWSSLPDMTLEQLDNLAVMLDSYVRTKRVLKEIGDE